MKLTIDHLRAKKRQRLLHNAEALCLINLMLDGLVDLNIKKLIYNYK